MRSDVVPSSHVPAVGALLGGRYRVEEILGSRGPVTRLVACHEPLDRRVILKLLSRSFDAPDAGVADRFARGARAAARLRGEHAARVHDVAMLKDGRQVLVLEHLSGHSLAAELEARGPLPIEHAVRYVLEACEALAEAHAAGFVHGNLTTASLFLAERRGEREIVKVVDFEDAAYGELQPRTERPLAEAAYLAPEQRNAPKSVDARANQWGLGVVLYELLAGVRPFAGDSPSLLLSAILQGAQRPLREVRSEVPAGLEAAVSRCLRVGASERFADVAVLAAALAPFATPRDRASAAVAARVLADLPPSDEPTAERERPRRAARTATKAFAFRPEPARAVAAPTPPGPPRAVPAKPLDRREEPTPEELLSAALFESVRRPWEHRQTGTDDNAAERRPPVAAGAPEVGALPPPRDRRREEG